jgi:hypothetical protein
VPVRGPPAAAVQGRTVPRDFDWSASLFPRETDDCLVEQLNQHDHFICISSLAAVFIPVGLQTLLQPPAVDLGACCAAQPDDSSPTVSCQHNNLRTPKRIAFRGDTHPVAPSQATAAAVAASAAAGAAIHQQQQA